MEAERWNEKEDLYKNSNKKAVLRIGIWICPDPKLFGIRDPDSDPKLFISDLDLDPAPDPTPDPPLFHTKL